MGDILVIDCEVRVSIEYVKYRAQQVSCLSQRAACPQQPWPIERIQKLHTKTTSISKFIPDHFSQMPHTKNNPSDSVGKEKLDLMGQERPPANWQKCLRNSLGQGSKPGRETTCENGHG
jgi:hypothetical protein